MKKIIVYLLLGLLTMLGVLYVLAWGDLIENKMLTGNILKDITKSFTYYIGWLPYWWFVIIIGTIFLALFFYGFRVGIEKFKG